MASADQSKFIGPKKTVLLNFFENGCIGSHMSPGQWRHPDDKSSTKGSIEYWTNLAKLAERGKISAIFIADGYSTHEVYGGSADPMLRAGTQVSSIDPTVVVPIMASVTKSLGFGITLSTSYITPYQLVRTLSSLDHLTNGRVAWNIVTSWSHSAAQALGYEDVVPHDERYARADEYMDVAYKLWEGSWADDSVLWDREAGVAYDPEKIKRIVHHGKYYNISAIGPLKPSPQRTPVLFQAGTSTTGRAFASKHAEAIYVGGLLPAQTKASIASIRAAASANGRDPQSVKFFVGISPIIGRTLEEAQAKYEKARASADHVGGLAQFSGYTGIDLSRFPLDEVFELKSAPGDTAIHSILENFNMTAGTSEPWTPRRLGETMALGGFHPAPVGTPEMIADVFEEWVNEADVDGFNIAYVTAPGSHEDVVDLLVPELQRRGLMWTDYPVAGGILRENLRGGPGLSGLRSDHYGYKFKYRSTFEGDSINSLKKDESTIASSTV